MSQENVLDILKKRGFVKQVTDEEAVRTTFDKKATIYVGFDPTADSLHVGNLVCLMAMANIQRAGHRVIAIIGDGTAMIGDPSGKTEMRQMLTRKQIVANAGRILEQVKRYIAIDDKSGFAVSNSDWLLQLNYVSFLREIGRHFSVNRMLAAEAYKARMETGLSFLEFSYQILQAYDFLQLYKAYDCTIQLGGDDQWGNILAGADLVRRVEGAAVEGITWPLITTANGQKMGKTASGAVWLDPERTSPYQFYQYWINCDDRDVGRFLALFTFLPGQEVERLAGLQGAEIRAAKEVLAFEATRLSHGKAEAEKARDTSRSAFGSSGDDLAGIPTTEVARSRLQQGVYVSDLFAEVGLTRSKGEARRLIKQGGTYVNQRQIADMEARLSEDDAESGMIMLRAGKKRFHRVIVVDK